MCTRISLCGRSLVQVRSSFGDFDVYRVPTTKGRALNVVESLGRDPGAKHDDVCFERVVSHVL